MLVDRPVRPAEEGIDVALRIGPLEDSGLIVRKLDDIQLVVCAAPDYLRRRGEPATQRPRMDSSLFGPGLNRGC
jgi:DNA-binding transcriptional LysR family regulator